MCIGRQRKFGNQDKKEHFRNVLCIQVTSSDWLGSWYGQKHLHLCDELLNKSQICQEISSLFISKSYPFLLIFSFDVVISRNARLIKVICFIYCNNKNYFFYRKEVQEIIGKSVKHDKYKFKYNSGLDYYPFQK